MKVQPTPLDKVLGAGHIVLYIYLYCVAAYFELDISVQYNLIHASVLKCCRWSSFHGLARALPATSG
jgi:hypothetical protein